MKKLIALVLLFAISTFADWSGNNPNLITTDLLYRDPMPPLRLYPEPQFDTTYKVIKVNSKLFITKEYYKIDTLRIEVK